VKRLLSVLMAAAIVLGGSVLGQDTKTKKAPAKKNNGEALSFKKDIFPIIEKNCLPCHAEDQFNPSELSLDNYELLMAGGKNGSPVTAGKSKESLMIKKLSENPPFGDRMPLNAKKKIKEGKAKWLSEEEIQAIATWIDQGAKNN
jgi:hypothetical protein